MNEYDRDKVDDVVLALLYLTRHEDIRTWKGHDWDALDRLYEKGYISDPKTKARSVVFTEEGLARSKHLFWQYFGKGRFAEERQMQQG